MTNDNKKMHLSFQPVLYERIVKMSKTYGISEPETIRKCINDYFDKIYTKSRVGFAGSDKLDSIRKESMIDVVTKFEAMSDEEANQHLIDIGFYTDEELEDKEFTITRDGGGNRVRRMRYKNGSMTQDDPFPFVVAEYKKFIRTNK